MSSIDFLISNDRHHVAILGPVLGRLAADDASRCRVLSLCELRGFPSPSGAAFPSGVRLRRVFPRSPRSRPDSQLSRSVKSRQVVRDVTRTIVWWALLRPRLQMLWSARPPLVVTLNDAAYPYDRIAALMRSRSLPFVLVQEGIRFPLPGIPQDRAYGAGGAVGLAVWGASSAAHFESIGVDPLRIHVTGCPRFDSTAPRSTLQDLETAPEAPPTSRSLLLLTNPIDAQGFCSTERKLELVRRFADGVADLLADRSLQLVIKLHGGEDEHAYREALAGSAAATRLEIRRQGSLEPLFDQAAAAIVMASTTGLEALMHSLPLGVLEIPGIGFVFDYVERQVAVGLGWTGSMRSQVERLLDYHPAADLSTYLESHVAHRGRATQNVADLVRRTARTTVGDRR